MVCNLRGGFYPMLSDFTAVANAIAATKKKSVKERLPADYLTTLDDAALFRGGTERITGIGGAAARSTLKARDSS